jgi:hypothetical protein
MQQVLYERGHLYIIGEDNFTKTSFDMELYDIPMKQCYNYLIKNDKSIDKMIILKNHHKNSYYIRIKDNHVSIFNIYKSFKVSREEMKEELKKHFGNNNKNKIFKFIFLFLLLLLLNILVFKYKRT